MEIELLAPVPGRVILPWGAHYGEPKWWAPDGIHRGTDYEGDQMAVIASAAGRVMRVAFEAGGYGVWILIQHAGFQTLYAHLAHTFVRPGQQVLAGDKIAISGNSGSAEDLAHLHFELLLGDGPGKSKQSIDPAPYWIAAQTPPEASPIAGISLAMGWEVLAETLNVRYGPGVEYDPPLHQLQRGDKVNSTRLAGSIWVEFAPGMYCAALHGDVQYLRPVEKKK